MQALSPLGMVIATLTFCLGLVAGYVLRYRKVESGHSKLVAPLCISGVIIILCAVTIQTVEFFLLNDLNMQNNLRLQELIIVEVILVCGLFYFGYRSAGQKETWWGVYWSGLGLLLLCMPLTVGYQLDVVPLWVNGSSYLLGIVGTFIPLGILYKRHIR